jgi:ABC-type transport system substrate-binding protein
MMASGDQASADGTPAKKLVVFNYFRDNAHKSLDPAAQFDSASGELIENLYEKLIDYHYLKRPYELTPALLAKLPILSEDKLTYTFELRKGVHFIDDACFKDGKGREVVADDIVYMLKRYADATVNTQSYPAIFSGFVKGLDEFRAKTRELGKGMKYDDHTVEGIKKTGKYTVDVTLTKPNPLAIFPFASSTMSIYPREAVEKYGEEFARHPVGTGPFKMHKYDRRGVMVFRRNDKFQGTYPTEGAAGDKEKGLLVDAGKKIPFIDEIRMPLIEEAQPRVLKFRRGEIDWIGLDKDNVAKMVTRDDKGFHLNPDYAAQFDMYAEPYTATEFWRVNMKDPVIGGLAPEKKALRQAIAYALDVPGYIQKMRNGRGSKLDTLVPTVFSGSQNELGFEGFSTNLEMAKKKLAEAGYPEGKGLPPIQIEFRASTNQTRQEYEYHRAQLDKVGIKLKGGFQTFSAWLRKTEAGNYQISAAGWHADYPDPENFYQLFYGPNKTPGPNNGQYVNPKYDSLFDQMRFMEPGQKRNGIIKEMAGILKDEVPVFIHYEPIVLGVYHKWVRNLKRNMMHNPPFRFLRIDDDVKKSQLPKLKR